jgi:hypothetical protein
MVTDNYYGVHDLGECARASLFGDPYISDCRHTAEQMHKDSDCSCRDSVGQMCRPTAADRAACTPASDTENFNPLVEWPNRIVCARNVRTESCRDAGDVDLAGAILRHIYPDIRATSRSSLLGSQPVQASGTATSELLSRQVAQFSQADFVRDAFAQSDQQAWASLADYGYVYVPESCSAGTACRLHVAFHGCKQGGETDWPYGNKFAKFAGYNEWARNNRIVVLYPQVMPSTLGPVNPEGCWDWWGYSGSDFFRRTGKQTRAVRAMLDRLLGN